MGNQTMKLSGLPKWFVSAPLIVGAALAITLSLPILLPVSLLLSLVPGFAGCWRALLFFTTYLYCETAGIFACGYLWLTRRKNREAYLQSNYRLQAWWAGTLKRGAEIFFDLRFVLHNTACLKGPAALLFARHTSIGDTVLPIVYYATPEKVQLRYVMKSELLWDPCLELVGNRLPNYFVARGSKDSAAEIKGVVGLLEGLPENEGVFLYPEGTRFAAHKRERLVRKSAQNAELQQHLERWQSLLPPRLGGSLGILDANPQRDLLFFAHVGFEGSADFAELINGAWAHTEVHLEFWRVPFTDIPQDPAGQQEFLYQQWDRMQATVDRLTALVDKPVD